MTTMIVTCKTPGCENEGFPIEIADHWIDYDSEGNPVERPIEFVQCGPCGNMIDLTPEF